MSLLTELEILGDEFLQTFRAYGAAAYPEGIMSYSPTATRLQHSARRCRDAGTATLGNGAQSLSTLKELQQMAATWCNPVGVENYFGR